MNQHRTTCWARIIALLFVGWCAMFFNHAVASQRESTHTLSKTLSIVGQPTTFAVTKPTLDTNNYRAIRLDNGLLALLVQVPESKKAAFAMSIATGNEFDPKEYQGLSHLLEHTVFLGSKSYPQRDGFTHFIKTRSGQYNAYTSRREVNYFMTIDARAVSEAALRFASLLSEPLFRRDDVLGERDVVDSEYHSYLISSARQHFDLLRQITPKKHPFHKFTVGDKTTLTDSPKPLEQALHDFFKRYYHAGNMRLVVSAPNSLDELETLTRQAFTSVQTARTPDKATAQLPHYQHLRASTSLPRLVRMQTGDTQPTLTIQFFTPLYKAERAQKPWYYIAEILGDEGEGSLAALLKTKGYITSLHAGSMLTTETDQLFGIHMELTERGRAAWQEITGLLLHHIETINSQPISQQLRTEQQALLQLDLQTKPQGELLSTTRQLATLLQQYRPQELLVAPYTLDLTTTTAIQKALKQLTPQRMEILLNHGDTAPLADKTKWFSVPYQIHQITHAQLADWRTQSERKAHTLRLPKPNAFVPTDIHFNQLSHTKDSTRLVPDSSFIKATVPTFVIHDSAADRLRGMLNREFIISPKPLTQREQMGLRLLAMIINNHMIEQLYPAARAGLSLNTSSNSYGLVLEISGYRQKQAELLRLWQTQFADLALTNNTLETARARLRFTLASDEHAPAYQQLSAWLRSTLVATVPTPDDQKRLLPTISLAEVKALYSQIQKSTTGRALLYGNYQPSLIDEINALLPHSAVQPTASRFVPLKQLTARRSLYSIPVTHDANNAVIWYAQGNSNMMTEQAIMLLLADIMQQAFFDSLRTEQQLGYIVSAQYRRIEDTPGIAFVVQSNHASTLAISEAIDLFIHQFVLTEAALNQHKQSLLLSLSTNPNNMAWRFARYRTELWRANAAFDTLARLRKTIAQVSLLDVQNALRTLKEGRTVLMRTDDGAPHLSGFIATTNFDTTPLGK